MHCVFEAVSCSVEELLLCTDGRAQGQDQGLLFENRVSDRLFFGRLALFCSLLVRLQDFVVLVDRFLDELVELLLVDAEPQRQRLPDRLPRR